MSVESIAQDELTSTMEFHGDSAAHVETTRLSYSLPPAWKVSRHVGHDLRFCAVEMAHEMIQS